MADLLLYTGIDLSSASAAAAIDPSIIQPPSSSSSPTISSGEVPLSAVVRWNGAEAAIFTALYQPSSSSSTISGGRGVIMRWLHSSSSLAVGVDDHDDGGDDGGDDDGDDKSDASRVRLLVPLGQSIHPSVVLPMVSYSPRIAAVDYLPTYLSIIASIYLSNYPSIYLYIYLSMHLCIYLCIYLSTHPSITSIHPSIAQAWRSGTATWRSVCGSWISSQDTAVAETHRAEQWVGWLCGGRRSVSCAER